MEKLKQENIDKAMKEIETREINELEVVEPAEVKKRNNNVTAKTLKAWMEQGRRIMNQGLVTDKNNILTLTKIMESVKKEWLNKNF